MFRLQRGPVGCLALLWLSWALLAACRSRAQPPTTLEPASVATSTATPEPLAAAPTATATPATATPTLPTTAPTPTATLSPAETELARGPSATRRPAQPTAVPPTPRLTPAPCPTRSPDEYVPLMWERSGPLPREISLANAHAAFLPPYDFFIGVENQVGYVRLDEPALLHTDPFSIFVFGFDEIPDLPPITDIEAPADELLYMTGGSRLTVVHAGDPCYLVPRATADFPFPTQNVELEGERIYVGGHAGDQLHVAVLDRTALPEIRQLAALTFPLGDWSVVGEQLLTVDPETGVVTVSDVSDLSAVTTRQVAVPFDALWNVMGQPQLFEDTLWLMVWDKGLMTVNGLLDPEPAALWREFHSYFAMDFVAMQETHTFVADNWCDAGNCSASVDIAGRDPEGEFAFFSLYPHHPVFHYHAVGGDVVLAFSDYSLIVLDLTAPEGQEIVRTYPLRGRLD